LFYGAAVSANAKITSATIELRSSLGVQMADEDLRAELEKLRAENEALKQRRRGGSNSMKVSEKGAVSVYGLGRFPVTLYKEQWEKLLSMADEIKAFMAENSDRLKTKE
jgi:hypothetical protein